MMSFFALSHCGADQRQRQAQPSATAFRPSLRVTQFSSSGSAIAMSETKGPGGGHDAAEPGRSHCLLFADSCRPLSPPPTFGNGAGIGIGIGFRNLTLSRISRIFQGLSERYP